MQIAHTVFCVTYLFFRDFFINVGDLNYGKAEKAAVMDTEKKKSLSIHIQDKSILLLICFPDIRATRVDHDKPYRKLLSFLLAFCKVVLLVFWYNNTPGYELGIPICPHMVFSCYFRKLWAFAPGIKDLHRQFLSCWLGQGHSP